MEALDLRLEGTELLHPLPEVFLPLAEVGVLHGDLALEAGKLLLEGPALLLDVGKVGVGLRKLLFGLAEALFLEENLVLELLEVAFLARDLAAEHGEGLLGGLALGLHADPVAAEFLEGAAVLVHLLGKALVLGAERNDPLAARRDALVDGRYLAVDGALLGDDALGREELVDEGGRRLAVGLVAALELLGSARGLHEVGLGLRDEGSGLFAGEVGQLLEVGEDGRLAGEPRDDEVDEGLDGLLGRLALLRGVARFLEAGVELGDDVLGDRVEALTGR